MKTVTPPSVAKTLHHELYHLIASLCVGIGFMIYFRNFWYGFLGFSLSMFLDVDHLVDYGLYILLFHKSFRFKEFLSGTYFLEWKKFITPLHSWEIVMASILMYLWYGYKISLVMAVALAVHYVIDYFTNDVNRMAYFIFYRMQYNFRKSAIKR